MNTVRKQLCDIYLDWRNNYLTIDVFAEHNGLTWDQAGELIDFSRKVFSSKHPEE